METCYLTLFFGSDLQASVHQMKAEKAEKERTLKDLEERLKELQERYTGAVSEDAEQQYEAELKKLEAVKTELKALNL